MTANVHDLLHLTQCVRDAGPLHIFSSFAYESMNHKLVKLIHGTQAVPQQLALGVTHLQCIPILAKDVLKDCASLQALSLYAHLGQTTLEVNEALATMCLGKGRLVILNQYEKHMVTTVLDCQTLGEVKQESESV